MRLTNSKRQEIGFWLGQIRNMEQALHDNIMSRQDDEVIRIKDELLVAQRFLLGELEVLINEADLAK